MAKQEKKVISRDEVQQALKRFKGAGGLITQLPAQIVPPRNRVGGKWGVYEIVTDTGEGVRN